MNIHYRTVTPADNATLAAIIRRGIDDLGLPSEGTAHSDPTTDDLSKLFTKPLSYYFVVETDGKVMGGCGIYPSTGLPDKYAELVRFFLDEKARGLGIGKQLMQECEALARQWGYTHLYLESFPEMKAAIHLYEKAGYQRLSQPLGNTGHFACNVWMVKEL
ncbi:MAG: GNAT family N-acetyltransferase [Bacteroidia bacterium]